MQPISVISVEDNQRVADVLARRLSSDSRFRWLGWAPDEQTLLSVVDQSPPDVVCMDIDMPGQDAFAMMRRLSERCPNARVLVLSGHTMPKLIQEAMEAGAWGYISKADEPSKIVENIRRVARGDLAFSEDTHAEYRRLLDRSRDEDEERDLGKLGFMKIFGTRK